MEAFATHAVEVLPADVAVIGGGPAGTAVALALLKDHPDLSVVVLEASGYDRFRAGEAIHPGAEALLRQLGVWEAFRAEEHLAAHGTRALWGSGEPIEHEFLFHRSGRGWHLDRQRFDAFLAREAEERGALVWRRARVLAAIQREGGIWHLRVRRGGLPLELSVRFVVDATGRGASFARRQGAARLTHDRLLALFRRTTLPPQVAIDTYTLVEAGPEGWWYSARLPEDRMVVALMSDADLLPREALRSFAAFVAKAEAEAPHTARRLLGAEPDGPPARVAAFTHRLDRFAGPGWLAVGDAALGFDPLSAGGIAFALNSALFAALAIADALAGQAAGLGKYSAFLEREFEGYLAARDDYYGRERRFADAPFWRRRQADITLDPSRPLRLRPGGEAPIASLGQPLPAADLALLLSLCGSPRPAHEIAADFRQRTSGRFPDRRIVLALQDLVAQRALVGS